MCFIFSPNITHNNSKQLLVLFELFGKGSLVCLALIQESQTVSFILEEKLSRKLTLSNFKAEAWPNLLCHISTSDDVIITLFCPATNPIRYKPQLHSPFPISFPMCKSCIKYRLGRNVIAHSNR